MGPKIGERERWTGKGKEVVPESERRSDPTAGGKQLEGERKPARDGKR